MEQIIKISNLNDFIFCPASIYYHSLYEELDRSVYQEIDQIRGSFVHESIDQSSYSTRKDILQGIEVYSARYNVMGKIDLYDQKKNQLVERKNKIKVIYDGYVFQLYAQYFGMIEQGHTIRQLILYSYTDNQSYPVPLPEADPEMLAKFEKLLRDMATFQLTGFRQDNQDKCRRCIYAQLCVSGGDLC